MLMEKIKDLFDNADSILILTHNNPDGDAIGSSLGLYNALIKTHTNVDVVINDVPSVFSFLTNFNMIKNTSKREVYDLVVTVDCADISRVNQDNNYFENAKYTLNIDHHMTNTRYANYNYVEDFSACCLYLSNIFDLIGIEIDEDVAYPLITGVITDTGGFQNSNTDYRTFDFASRISKLIDIHSVYKKVFATKSRGQFELSRIAISRLEIIDDKIAFTFINKEDFNLVNANIGDHEGIVNIGREIEGIIVSIFVREMNYGYKVSLRSNNDFDVSVVASEFDGGGHRAAAGFDSDLSFSLLKGRLINVLRNKING